MRRLMREVATLRNSPPDGLRVTASEEDMLDIIGIIKGPECTPYEGGYFRVKFQFTEEFPAAPPKCTMLTKIFHPNVSKAGEICVNTLKRDWKKEYGIQHILVTIKCLLIYPNAESALDEAAGKLLLEDYEGYCKHARIMTNVHATPRTRPPEFDVPSASTSPMPAQSSKSSSSDIATRLITSSTSSATSTSTSTSTPSLQTLKPSTSAQSSLGAPEPSAQSSQISPSASKPASKSGASSPLFSVIESTTEPLQPSPSNNSTLPIPLAASASASREGSPMKENEGSRIVSGGSASKSGPLLPAATNGGISSEPDPPTSKSVSGGSGGALKRPGGAGGAAAKRKKGLRRL